MMTNRAFLPFFAALVLSIAFASGEEQWVYFGTGGKGAEGIYLSRLDLEKGALTPPVLAAEEANPGFLAIHPNGKYLYSVCALPGVDRQKSGGVSAFRMNPSTGILELIGRKPSRGSGPCHLVVDRKGRCVLVANYGGGSVAALPIDTEGGLKEASAIIQHEGSSINPKRQGEPHAHSVNVDAANRYAFVADLGTDEVVIYQFDSKNGGLKPHGATKVAPGAGPRHFAIHPDGETAYVINELASTITVFDYDAEEGTLEERQTVSTLPEDHREPNSTAEVQVHPSGRFVYGSNRGHDTIAVFRVGDDGELTFVEREPVRGEIPRNFGIDPTGAYLLAAGQRSNTVAVFKINQETGALDFTGSEIEVPAPICVVFSAILDGS